MEIVVYSPEIPGNVGAIIRLSANSGIPVNFIKPFGFNFQAGQAVKIVMSGGKSRVLPR